MGKQRCSGATVMAIPHNAMPRRATYGTIAPQIKLRFFGGWDNSANDGASPDLVERGYRSGVPMGGQLSTFWSDPDFNADQHAFYYVRVLEIPSPRGSTYDSIAGRGIPAGLPATIQERAFSSPVWYTP